MSGEGDGGGSKWSCTRNKVFILGGIDKGEGSNWSCCMIVTEFSDEGDGGSSNWSLPYPAQNSNSHEPPFLINPIVV